MCRKTQDPVFTNTHAHTRTHELYGILNSKGTGILHLKPLLLAATVAFGRRPVQPQAEVRENLGAPRGLDAPGVIEELVVDDPTGHLLTTLILVFDQPNRPTLHGQDD